MGIAGLLQLFKSIQRPCQLKQFAGQTLGVDAYGWLHRGTAACTLDLALENPTRKHIDFALHRVKMLIHFGVTPYIVFDGDFLPSKAVTEASRAKSRLESKREGLELYRLNKRVEAQQKLQKAVDVTPLMARQLIDELKKLDIPYVVAPYEADAQLVYLEKQGLIHGIISEDSDLLVFGAARLLTKLDQYGSCIEIRQCDFSACREISLTAWTHTQFRTMAILSGCDYLPSISGMGLIKSYRCVRKYKDIDRILRILKFDGKFHVPEGYLEAFKRAELTFLYQWVFCPKRQELVMLNVLDDENRQSEMPFIGSHVEKDVAMAVAKGDIDPVTKMSFQGSCIQSGQIKSTGMASKFMKVGGKEQKGSKSIKSFFHTSGRVPLAELDVNSFTPSPTQQNLQQNANGRVWQSSPLNISASTPTPTTIGRLLSPATTSGTLKRRNFRVQGDHTTGMVEDDIKSPFFSTKTARPDKRVKRQAGTDFSIWSDDSVEQLMINMADSPCTISASDKSAGLPGSTQSQCRRQEVKSKSVTTLEPKVEGRSLLRNAILNREASAISSESSHLNSMQEAESAKSINIERTSTSFVARNKDEFCQQNSEILVSAAETRRSSTQQDETLLDHMDSTTKKTGGGLDRSSGPRRQKSLTALQRLRTSVLSRSKSCEGIGSIMTLPDQSITQKSSSMPQTRRECLKATISALVAVPQRGSEDAMIPDSEEEDEEDIELTEQQDQGDVLTGHSLKTAETQHGRRFEQFKFRG